MLLKNTDHSHTNTIVSVEKKHIHTHKQRNIAIIPIHACTVNRIIRPFLLHSIYEIYCFLRPILRLILELIWCPCQILLIIQYTFVWIAKPFQTFTHTQTHKCYKWGNGIFCVRSSAVFCPSIVVFFYQS